MPKHGTILLILVFLFTNLVSSQDLSSNNTLINCEQGKTLLFGLCITLIPFCNSYQNGGQCQSCDQTYVLSNGYCIPQALFSNTGSISLQTYFLQQPKDHTDISSNSLINKTCNNRQYLTSEGCQDIGLECLQFEPNGTCTSCSENFYIYNGLCVEKIFPHKKKTLQNSNLSQSSKAQTNLTSQNIPTNPSHTELSHFAQQQATNSCFATCATCYSDNPNYCTSCISGYTTVDGIEGQCFSF